MFDVIEDIGGYELGDSKKSKDLDRYKLLTLTVLKYGANPLFDTNVDTSRKVGVCSLLFRNTSFSIFFSIIFIIINVKCIMYNIISHRLLSS